MSPQYRMDDKAYELIKRRHPDIPQEPLPLDLPEQLARHDGEQPDKPRPAKSIRFASCPKCLASREFGVIRAADGTEVFRDHNKTIGKGVRMLCPGSGTTAPAVRTL